MNSRASANELFRYLGDLTVISRHPEIEPYLRTWIQAREPIWRALAEICFRAAGGKDLSRLDRILLSWMVLFAVSGPLDDYTDRDKSPSVWVDLGRDKGTFVALALIAEALALAIEPNPSSDPILGHSAAVLAKHLRDASLGQALDTDAIQTLEEYEAMLELKAASLVVALTESVAVVAEASPTSRLALINVGKEVGIAIQIVNDYLGIWRPESVSKHGGGDLESRKVTYPILFALRSHDPRAVEFRRLFRDDSGRTNPNLMLEILNQIGAREFLLAAIYLRRTSAIRHMEDLASEDDVARFAKWCDENLLGQEAR